MKPAGRAVEYLTAVSLLAVFGPPYHFTTTLRVVPSE